MAENIEKTTHPNEEPLLEVQNLHTFFKTRNPEPPPLVPPRPPGSPAGCLRPHGRNQPLLPELPRNFHL